MNLANIKTIKEILNKYNLRPTKLRGQHFLISQGVLQEIVKAASLTKDDLVLEIGPGLGALTQELARRVRRVIAVEKDRRFLKVLKEELIAFQNIEVIEGDILNIPAETFAQLMNQGDILNVPAGTFAQFMNQRYKIVANIPYNITSDILIKFLSDELKPEMLVLMIQKEVADRILERDGKSSRLSIFVNYFGKPELVARVPAVAFYPAPEVDSAIIKITPYEIGSPLEIRSRREKDFFDFVRTGFSHPRKKLTSNLKFWSKFHFDQKELIDVFRKLNFDLNIRPENLYLEGWVRLFDALTRS